MIENPKVGQKVRVSMLGRAWNGEITLVSMGAPCSYVEVRLEDERRFCFIPSNDHIVPAGEEPKPHSHRLGQAKEGPALLECPFCERATFVNLVEFRARCFPAPPGTPLPTTPPGTPPPTTKPSSPPVSVWVRVKAEIEFELPSPWDGKTSHNDLVPIAKREAREVLQEHLPPKGRIIDIHTVQTSVVSETKEKT